MCSEQIKCRKLACVVIRHLGGLPTGFIARSGMARLLHRLTAVGFCVGMRQENSNRHWEGAQQGKSRGMLRLLNLCNR